MEFAIKCWSKKEAGAVSSEVANSKWRRLNPLRKATWSGPAGLEWDSAQAHVLQWRAPVEYFPSLTQTRFSVSLN
jgi:hypothetical protein